LSWRSFAKLSQQSILIAAALAVATPGWALDNVSLQLKWLHQFQFAGYYAALERGFYRDAGLDVAIREGGPTIDTAAAVREGKADFGVCGTEVLLGKPDARPLVVLGVIFQHSAAIILVPSRAHVSTLADLKGHRLMDTPGVDVLAAMLKQEGVDYASLPRVQHNGDPRDLVEGKADAMIAYSTNEPFVLEQLGIPYQSFSPRAFGFDFYGDNLCTSADAVKAHPERTRAFLAASLKGWAYALAHKEEVVQLILSRYSKRKSRDALLFEANESEELIQPRLIELGSQTTERWQSIANTYHDLGMLADARLPDTLIYRPRGGLIDRWLRPLLVGLVLIAVGAILLRFAYERILTSPLAPSLTRPKLSAIMAGLFVGLSIPVLIFVLLYSYHRNSQAIIATLHEDVGRSRQASIESMQTMIGDVASTLRLVAEVAAADQGFFRKEQSRDTLYQALTSAAEIDAVYVSFEDGYHRVVTRIDDDRRRSDPKIPAAANWHSSYIDDFAAGDDRRRHRTFFDIWGHTIGQYDVPSTLDVTSLPGYAAARESGALVVTEPAINPDTGHPIIYVRVPILRDGAFLGCATANLTFSVLSQFLATHRASPHSKTIIADPDDGRIIVASENENSVRVVGDQIEVAKLENVSDADVREAYRLQTQTNRDEFLFRSPRDGAELSASFSRFPESFGHPWEAIVLTPTSDFIGYLEATNRQIIAMIIALTAGEFLLIYYLSRRLSRPIESISQDLQSVENLAFELRPSRPSKVREIAQLQSAASLLRNSLMSFSAFAPVDVVRGLIKSGIPLALGVEKRCLTILFSDLENFSSRAEQSNPDDLLAQMSVYFEQVSRAISDEQGTVDKFIGDGVMAFWGAPHPLPDHALRACAGALRAARRMERVNARWRAEGRPTFRVRIGLNSAEVLVGNVGSSDRFSYTAMGDGVNVAARLEGVNKGLGTTICISDSVFDAVSDKIVARPIRRVTVKGRKQAFMIYELLGIVGSEDPELTPRANDKTLSDMSLAASDCFEQGSFSEAAYRYRAILKMFPDDPVAQAMLQEATAHCAPAVAAGV
jgi:class 3 adenylate cyclase/ABC-type nitrate/sulfonate/bicarbonate transport system substrate-binding protein